MTFNYECDDCGKEFNLQIKLKKHREAVHSRSKEFNPPDYLDVSVTFTDDEKAMYFDDLRAKFEEIKSKIDNLKLVNGEVSPEIKKPLKRKSKYKRASFDTYEQVPDDKYTPEGWKCAYGQYFQEQRRKCFEAPDGTFCQGRRLAIVHMRTELNSPQADILLMRKGMIEEDGWKESEDIPEGWLTKSYDSHGERDQPTSVFVTHDYKYIKSSRGAVQELLVESYTDKIINNFICSYFGKSLQRPRPDEIKWKQDENVPELWKIGHTSSVEIFLTPTGNVLLTKGSVLKFIKRTDAYDDKAKEQLRKFFLNPRNNFNIAKIAPKSTRRSDGKRSSIGSNPELWTERTNLFIPTDWKVYVSSDLKQKKFLNPEGKAFTVSEALRFMVENNYPEDCIQRMKEGLIVEDGWTTTDYMPEGWLCKLTKVPDRTSPDKKYMTPTFKVVDSYTDIIEALKLSGATKDDIYKFKSAQNWEANEELPKGWMQRAKNFLNMTYMGPDGRFCSSAANVYKYFLSAEYDNDDMEKGHEDKKKVVAMLRREGWAQSEGLPDDWWARKLNDGPSSFLTESGDKIRTVRLALRFMMDNQSKYSQSIISKFKSHFNATYLKTRMKKEMSQIENEVKVYNSGVNENLDENKPKPVRPKRPSPGPGLINNDGWLESSNVSLPKGWKLFTCKTDTRQRMFVSPEGKSFYSFDALRYMVETRHSTEEIEMMKEGFLAEDGWKGPDFMPAGWLMKINEHGSKYYLSPNFVKVSTLEKAITIMKQVGTSDEQIHTFKIGCEWEDNLQLPRGWMQTMRNTDLSVYRAYLSPEGKYFPSSHHVYKYLKSLNNVEEEDYKRINTILEEDGWKCIEGLPDKWLAKKHHEKEKERRYMFLTEKGEKLQSSRRAEVYMVDNNYSKDIITKFKSTLHSNWLTREPRESKVKMERNQPINEDKKRAGSWVSLGNGKYKIGETVLRSLKEAITYMRKENYSDDIIENLKENAYDTIPLKGSEELPKGWMTGVVEGLNTMHKFLSPDGDFLNGRAAAIKLMIENRYDVGDIEMMKSLLVTKDGWEYDDNMPEGWMKKELPNSDTIYLSPMYEICRRKNLVIKLMKKAVNGYSEEIIKRTEEYLYGSSTSGRMKIKAEPLEDAPQSKKPRTDVLDWKSDQDLPSEWKIAKFGDKIKISNSSGDIFHSRIEAIEYMIKHEQSPVDIFKLWNNLHLEGWDCDEQNLPSGWRRKAAKKMGHYEYLSPLMDVVTSSDDFLKHILLSSDYSQEDRDKAKQWVEKCLLN